jgi:FAD/FMN-containing dehydrogenase
MTMSTLADPQDGLAAMLGPGAVLTDPADLEKYETGWRYGKGRALLVVRPASTAQVSQVLAFCRERGLRVLPQGANTGLVGASVPDPGGRMVVLSLERLNHRLALDELDRTVTVDAGVLLSALNEALAEHGLTFPVDLPADPQIGGMIAANTGGARLLRYGDVRRNLLGLEVVLADGRVVDALTALRKNNTGLDFKQLFTGTSGVFGVITGAVLQVTPLPRQRAAALVGVQHGPAALGLLQALEHGLSELLAAFEVMSRASLEPVFGGRAQLRNPFGATLAPYTVLVELAPPCRNRPWTWRTCWNRPWRSTWKGTRRTSPTSSWAGPTSSGRCATTSPKACARRAGSWPSTSPCRAPGCPPSPTP